MVDGPGSSRQQGPETRICSPVLVPSLSRSSWRSSCFDIRSCAARVHGGGRYREPYDVLFWKFSRYSYAWRHQDIPGLNIVRANSGRRPFYKSCWIWPRGHYDTLRSPTRYLLSIQFVHGPRALYFGDIYQDASSISHTVVFHTRLRFLGIPPNIFW